jgi:hypothetical protein
MFAEKAVEMICHGKGNMAVGLQDGEIMGYALEKAAKERKPIDLRLLEVADMLAT